MKIANPHLPTPWPRRAIHYVYILFTSGDHSMILCYVVPLTVRTNAARPQFPFEPEL